MNKIMYMAIFLRMFVQIIAVTASGFLVSCSSLRNVKPEGSVPNLQFERKSVLDGALVFGWQPDMEIERKIVSGDLDSGRPPGLQLLAGNGRLHITLRRFRISDRDSAMEWFYHDWDDLEGLLPSVGTLDLYVREELVRIAKQPLGDTLAQGHLAGAIDLPGMRSQHSSVTPLQAQILRDVFKIPAYPEAPEFVQSALAWSWRVYDLDHGYRFMIGPVVYREMSDLTLLIMFGVAVDPDGVLFADFTCTFKNPGPSDSPDLLLRRVLSFVYPVPQSTWQQ